MFWGRKPQNNLKIGVAVHCNTARVCGLVVVEYQMRKSSDGTINKQPQTFNFLCFFLVILFNPLWGFLRLGNSAREFLGVNFSSRDFISALISAPLRSPSSYWLWSTQRPSPLPLPGWWWAIILWCGDSITFQPSTSFGWKQQESVPFFPRSHHDSAQAYFATFRMRFSDS